MDAIYIPQLLTAPEKTDILEVNEVFESLETLTPVRGKIQVKHCGTYLEVSGKAETIVTLTCDRCLQQYNHRVSVETTELIWLDENAESVEMLPLEREVPLEDLSENLSPRGYFDPQEWLYEQLCLALPQRQLCNQNCSGIADEILSSRPKVDSRWASLESLKAQLHSQETKN